MFSAADAYDRFVGRYAPALAGELIDAAGIRPPQRVLDVGCGTGALTHELAALVGAANVAAVDPSTAFVSACRARNPGVAVAEGSAEALPFDDGSFDAALAQLVVNFMADALRGVREMIRVTRPTGVVAAATWDYGDQMYLLRRFWDAAITLDPTTTRDERHMRFCTPDDLGGLWTDAGLANITVRAAVVSASYTDFDDLWGPIEQGVGPAGAYAVSLAAEHRAALKQEYMGLLGVGSAAFELTARAWIATGTVR